MSRASALCWGSRDESRPCQGDPGKFRDSRPLKVDMWSSQGSGSLLTGDQETLLGATRSLEAAGAPSSAPFAHGSGWALGPAHPAQAQVLFHSAPHC